MYLIPPCILITILVPSRLYLFNIHYIGLTKTVPCTASPASTLRAHFPPSVIDFCDDLSDESMIDRVADKEGLG